MSQEQPKQAQVADLVELLSAAKALLEVGSYQPHLFPAVQSVTTNLDKVVELLKQVPVINEETTQK